MKPGPRLVVILGPTASGKSALGIWLAERRSGEVVVCDSTQVYRGFDIGTAKVAPSERHGIPHHLIDLVEPEELFTAGEYRRRTLVLLEDLRGRGKLPILTAGTGLYLRALLEGLADAPQRSESLRERLRERVRTRGASYLHRLLARIDPEAAARIAPRDAQKSIRAIEISLLSGRPLTEVYRDGQSGLEGFQVIKIGLEPPRAELYARIHKRVEAMIGAGWLDEVCRLVKCGVPATAKPFQFIGYSQLRDHLVGKCALERVIQEIQQATRRYAKSQLTWFRKEKDVRWFPGFGDDTRLARDVLQFIE